MTVDVGFFFGDSSFEGSADLAGAFGGLAWGGGPAVPIRLPSGLRYESTTRSSSAPRSSRHGATSFSATFTRSPDTGCVRLGDEFAGDDGPVDGRNVYSNGKFEFDPHFNAKKRASMRPISVAVPRWLANASVSSTNRKLEMSVGETSKPGIRS